MTRIGILGAGGRMGRELIQAVAARPGAELAAAVVRPGSAMLGRDAGELAGTGTLGVTLGDDPAAAAAASDVLIDFTLPAAFDTNLAAARAARVPITVGTTGLDGRQLGALETAAREIPVVFAPNYSSGVTLACRLAALAARALGDEFDVEIIEAHHRHKVDAPSGTARRLGEVVAGALGRDLDAVACYGREGHTGARDAQTIGFQSIRGGDIVGEHTVLFAGEGERIEITHRASSRRTFAGGAVRAACWLVAQPPGRYGMEEVLGLTD
ncbi:4-hydroxy-tetrahydrodipicolinate reductase [Sediminicurvatus halobius]|uniref:4-hydroxy-tetrahydrodipicolinate reductase n=1 Tax=Sediminicurvatus halobius TaxID=2182432 RepID=A0A2U2MXT4_9GAMM|nr:4-hydroxy-tetrahydrodipicolinate reductase [Spiribacter halobius]PWG61670.1 4-hydroxy-tetrahydrodipicolinate reductase [Spiribacter halobius]UEX79431.1 4-hydroxy-tetrahydrodipicolinate reductase [Spiribacter halobius]